MADYRCIKDAFRIPSDLVKEINGNLNYLYKSFYKRLPPPPPQYPEMMLILKYYNETYNRRMYKSLKDYITNIMNNMKNTNGNKFCEEAMKCRLQQEEKNVIVTAKNVIQLRSKCADYIHLPEIDNVDESKLAKHNFFHYVISLFKKYIYVLQCNVEANENAIDSFFIFTLDNSNYSMFILEPTYDEQVCDLIAEVVLEDNNSEDEICDLISKVGLEDNNSEDEICDLISKVGLEDNNSEDEICDLISKVGLEDNNSADESSSMDEFSCAGESSNAGESSAMPFFTFL